jgi:hypothetical protein
MVRNLPARAGEQILRRLAYLLESIGVDVTVEVREAARASGAIFRLLTTLLAQFWEECTASARLSGMVQSQGERGTVDLKAREQDTSIGDACA